MAKKKKKMSEKEWKATNVKPEIPLDIQQSIMEVKSEATKEEKQDEEA